MKKFKVNDIIVCNNIAPLEGNEVAPPLEFKKEYKVESIIEDKEANQHLNVGLKSKYNYIRSYETKEELPNGDKIHWCHPSRFDLKS